MTAAVLAVKQRLERRSAEALVLGALAVALAGVAASGIGEVWQGIVARAGHWSPTRIGTTASLLAGLATAVGAAPVFFVSRVPQRRRAMLLAFGAGVMLAASLFSLIVPGFQAARPTAGAPSAALIVAAGIGLGALFLYLAQALVPHRRVVPRSAGPDAWKAKGIWLFVAAITLHNLPEGLAVGVGFGQGDLARGTALALGIGLQNLPEGLVVALALAAAGYGRMTAWAAALASGLVEPLGGLLGAGAVAIAQPLLPWALAFAAGAMLLVVTRDILPVSFAYGRDRRVASALLGGFVVMMTLDVTFG